MNSESLHSFRDCKENVDNNQLDKYGQLGAFTPRRSAMDMVVRAASMRCHVQKISHINRISTMKQSNSLHVT